MQSHSGKRALVVAPHPDDEVLGAGATIHRLASAGCAVTVAIVTKGWEPLFPATQFEQVRAEAERANRHLGVDDLRFLDLPVTRLHALERHELNAVFDALVADVRPHLVLLPFRSDRHEDHRQVFDACQVALRPVAARAFVEKVACFETVSETHWSAVGAEPGFEPQWYVDVTAHLDAKLEAMRMYASQVRAMPDARSLEAIRALAVFRGSTVGMHAAEAFVVLRERTA